MMRPYPTTMMASGLSAISRLRNSSFCLIFSGCVTGSPSSRARCLTGDAVSSMPRPRGRSGCVTARLTWKPASTNFSSVATAKRGVPQKTRLRYEGIASSGDRVNGHTVRQSHNRSISRSLPLSRLHQLADLALHQVAFQRTDVADIELAIQVIGFMQKCPRQQLFASFLVPLAVHILGADGHVFRPRHLFTEFRNTQAAFAATLPAFLANDLWVRYHQL